MSRKEELLKNLRKITEKEKPSVPAGPKQLLISNQYGEDANGDPIYIDRMYGGINGKYRLLQGKYGEEYKGCLLYTSPSPRDKRQSRMPSSA